MDYISVKEASELWGIDTSNIGKLCRKGKIEGAKLVGKSWLIPKNAEKPIDGRTRIAKEKQNSSVFRFPLYVNFPEDSFVPPLSKEEARLRQAEVDFFACEFQKSKAVFEKLAEAAESVYVKLCAQFFMCVLSAVYDINISWEKYYCAMNLLLSADFPCKKEMELFLLWLDFTVGRIGNIPNKLNTDPAYEYHPTAWYMSAFLSVFNYDGMNEETTNTKCTEPFGTLCRLMERDGCCVEAQELHMVLFIYQYGMNNNEAMQYHLRKAVRLAYEHGLLYVLADAETYYADAVNAVLNEYPDSFADRIRQKSLKIYENFSRFAEKSEKTSIYAKLSKNDFRFVFYAVEGFSNNKVAGICKVSQRTVATRYNEIYEKLGVKSKQELVDEMSLAFGKKHKDYDRTGQEK